MPQPLDLRLLARYLDGVATDRERAAVDAWTKRDPQRLAMLAQLEAAWQSDAERLGTPPDAEAVWGRLSHELGLSDAELRVAQPSHVLRLIPPRRSAWSAAKVAKWAAAIAGVTVVGLGTWQVFRGRVSQVAVTAPQIREYVTPRGQRASFRLADGSEVMLNADSRLRVPLTLGTAGSARTVDLEGQGYFIVVHNDRQPFTVRTAYGVTRDVGTRFDIRAYAEDSLEYIVVAEGEVAVRAATASGPGVPLYAGQMATVASNGHVAVAPAAEIQREIAWTNGHLELRDVTLGEAARRLGRWYGLDIHVANQALANRRVSGSYADEPIADVLTVLTATVGARYEWRGRTVTFIPADRTP